MPNNLLAVRSPAAQLDPDTHAECLEFFRSAIAEVDRQTAKHVAAILKDCYQNGYLDRAAIWRDLSSTEQQQFKELLAPPRIARDFARRIREALGYNSPAVAGAVQNDLDRAIDAGNVTVADVLAVVGAGELGEFDRLMSFHGTA